MSAPSAPPPATRLVVIDSGVDAGHPQVRGRCAFTAGPSFGEHGVVDPHGGGRDELGHGTAIAAAILHLAPGCELVSLRVFDREPECPFARVLAALDLALTLRPQVVNLSLGTTALAWREPLAERLRAAAGLGVRVVAPASWQGLPAMPGSLPGCDGVVADGNVLRQWPERRRADDRDWWFAQPAPPPLPGGTLARARGESIATACVSAFLLRATSAQPA